jgi:hypothetical protein
MYVYCAELISRATHEFATQVKLDSGSLNTWPLSHACEHTCTLEFKPKIVKLFIAYEACMFYVICTLSCEVSARMDKERV